MRVYGKEELGIVLGCQGGLKDRLIGQVFQ